MDSVLNASNLANLPISHEGGIMTLADAIFSMALIGIPVIIFEMFLYIYGPPKKEEFNDLLKDDRISHLNGRREKIQWNTQLINDHVVEQIIFNGI